MTRPWQEACMTGAARRLLGSGARLALVEGAMFNDVMRASAGAQTLYLKRINDRPVLASLPPMPTSAAQRFEVALGWHALAKRAAMLAGGVTVPAIAAVDLHHHVIAMQAVRGAPLHARMLASTPLPLTLVLPVVDWMACLHGLDLQPRRNLLEASAPFKAYKVALQYFGILDHLPPALHGRVQRFARDYLAMDAEPVHGDLNTRNVLCAEDTAGVIDFEQGHFGDGVYDLAYLVAEFVIGAVRHAQDPAAVIAQAWGRYASGRGWCEDAVSGPRDAAGAGMVNPARHADYRAHLAIQTLYRLTGPSRQVWTGHLAGPARGALRAWAVQEASTWLP